MNQAVANTKIIWNYIGFRLSSGAISRNYLIINKIILIFAPAFSFTNQNTKGT